MEPPRPRRCRRYYTPNATQLAGNAYSDTSCLESCQNDPAQPGRTDGIVNGMPSVKGTACPVCNSTHPCLCVPPPPSRPLLRLRRLPTLISRP